MRIALIPLISATAVCKLKQETRNSSSTALPDITMIRLWGIETLNCKRAGSECLRFCESTSKWANLGKFTIWEINIGNEKLWSLEYQQIAQPITDKIVFSYYICKKYSSYFSYTEFFNSEIKLLSMQLSYFLYSERTRPLYFA